MHLVLVVLVPLCLLGLDKLPDLDVAINASGDEEADYEESRDPQERDKLYGVEIEEGLVAIKLEHQVRNRG